jgi:hypothetical protein
MQAWSEMLINFASLFPKKKRHKASREALGNHRQTEQSG